MTVVAVAYVIDKPTSNAHSWLQSLQYLVWITTLAARITEDVSSAPKAFISIALPYPN